MASNHGSLVKEATLQLDQFRAGKQCLDDFLEDASQVMKNVEAEDKRFILDIVSGCVEHKKLLDKVINVFYAQNGKCLSRGDRHQFVMICYLAMFMQDALGFPHFSNIIKSLDIKKMHTFLTFFFTNLTTWIRGEWSQIYDAAYVDRTWIAPLLRWRPEIDALLDQLAARMSRGGAQVKKDPTKKTTEPQEFSLTKPKPRLLLAPEAIPSQEKHKPVPKSTYRLPNEIQAVEEMKHINRQKAEQMLYEVNIKQFKCANPQKSEHAKNVLSQIREDFDSKLKFNSFHSSGAPATHKVETNTLQVKLNNTVILREGALYNRQVEVELQRMERLVEGEGEPSSFLRWQKEMRDRDLQESIAQVERRRLEGLISHEEAAMARTRIMEHNQKNVQLKKEETAQLMQRYAQKRLQEEKGMRDLVQKVTEGHKNSKAAKVKLQEFKQRIVKEVSEQIQDLLRQALEEAQAELSRKFEIIREIHAMESVPFIRHRFLDDTETAGHDLLGEMSLAELKERLAILKEAERHEQQKRHERILEEKHNKELLLLDQMDAIDLHRKALSHAAAHRKEEKKERLALQQKAVAGDERVLALQRKLADKQQERQRLRENERNKVKSTEQANNTHAVKNSQHKKKTLEKQCWEDLERSLEHQVQKESPNTQDIDMCNVF